MNDRILFHKTNIYICTICNKDGLSASRERHTIIGGRRGVTLWRTRAAIGL